MLGSCLEIASPPSLGTTGDPIHDLLPPQEYILAFVVPALIIVGMLLLAIVIACILHRFVVSSISSRGVPRAQPKGFMAIFTPKAF